ncbi:hypothetical protein ACHAWF_017772 [Thalassiosira exigua]
MKTSSLLSGAGSGGVRLLPSIMAATASLLLFRVVTANSHLRSPQVPRAATRLAQRLAFNPPRHQDQTPGEERRSMMSTSSNNDDLVEAPGRNQGRGDDNSDPSISLVPPLRYLGDRRLMQTQPPATPEEIRSEAFQRQIAMLPRAMKEHGGIGIAAPQVGWWTRAFCFGIEGTNPRYPDAAEMPLQTWINPEIAWASEETCWMWEGCLSVPGVRGWVERPKEVIMTGLDEHGAEREPRRLAGLPARVAQHELDHLDGVLFPSKTPGREFLVPQASMDARDGWAPNWPSPGSFKTQLGALCDEK